MRNLINLANQYTVQEKICVYPGCPLLINTILHASHKQYCEFHVTLRVKENWQKQNHKNSTGQQKPKIMPMIYLFKTNKVVSIYEIMAYCRIRQKNTVFSHISTLRSQGHKIKRCNGFYVYGGMKC